MRPPTDDDIKPTLLFYYSQKVPFSYPKRKHEDRGVYLEDSTLCPGLQGDITDAGNDRRHWVLRAMADRLQVLLG